MKWIQSKYKLGWGGLVSFMWKVAIFLLGTALYNAWVLQSPAVSQSLQCWTHKRNKPRNLGDGGRLRRAEEAWVYPGTRPAITPRSMCTSPQHTQASADAYKLTVGEMESNPDQPLTIQPSIKQLVHKMALLNPFSTASQWEGEGQGTPQGQLSVLKCGEAREEQLKQSA